MSKFFPSQEDKKLQIGFLGDVSLRPLNRKDSLKQPVIKVFTPQSPRAGKETVVDNNSPKILQIFKLKKIANLDKVQNEKFDLQLELEDAEVEEIKSARQLFEKRKSDVHTELTNSLSDNASCVSMLAQPDSGDDFSNTPRNAQKQVKEKFDSMDTQIEFVDHNDFVYLVEATAPDWPESEESLYHVMTESDISTVVGVPLTHIGYVDDFQDQHQDVIVDVRQSRISPFDGRSVVSVSESNATTGQSSNNSHVSTNSLPLLERFVEQIESDVSVQVNINDPVKISYDLASLDTATSCLEDSSVSFPIPPKHYASLRQLVIEERGVRHSLKEIIETSLRESSPEAKRREQERRDQDLAKQKSSKAKAKAQGKKKLKKKVSFSADTEERQRQKAKNECDKLKDKWTMLRTKF